MLALDAVALKIRPTQTAYFFHTQMCNQLSSCCSSCSSSVHLDILREISEWPRPIFYLLLVFNFLWKRTSFVIYWASYFEYHFLNSFKISFLKSHLNTNLLSITTSKYLKCILFDQMILGSYNKVFVELCKLYLWSLLKKPNKWYFHC